MRNYGGVTGVLGHLYRLKRFVRVPIWLMLDERSVSDPVFNTLAGDPAGLVRRYRRPTTLDRAAQRSVRDFQPAQTSSASPSSMEMIGYARSAPRVGRIICPNSGVVSRDFRTYGCIVIELARRHIHGRSESLPGPVAGGRDGVHDAIDGSFVRLEIGAKPPSSPTAVFSPFF